MFCFNSRLCPNFNGIFEITVPSHTCESTSKIKKLKNVFLLLSIKVNSKLGSTVDLWSQLLILAPQSLLLHFICMFLQAAKEFESELKKEPEVSLDKPTTVSEEEKEDAKVSSSKESVWKCNIVGISNCLII